MKTDEYYNIFAHEQTHFFYLAVHELVLTLLQKYSTGYPSNREILDAGCGVGGLSVKLKSFGAVHSIDANDHAIELAEKQGVSVKQALIEELPFADSTFDVCTCIDVIYHRSVISDSHAIQELYRVLKVNGLLIVRVPAREELFSNHDLHVYTARRYSLGQLTSTLVNAGFQLEYASYCQGSLYLPALVKATAERIFAQQETSAVRDVNPTVNKLLSIILRAENRFLAANGRLPIGIGAIAVARKVKSEASQLQTAQQPSQTTSHH